MSEAQKDTVYIDIDDEITTVIDKLKSSPHKIVALVLPKRAAVLHSSVNMKLLKRTADESKKQAVLITSEAALLPLAGATGMYVARTLQSKPEIPPGPGESPSESDTTPETEPGEPPVDKALAVGALAAAANDEDETIEVDNSSEAAAAAKSSKAAKAKPKKDKKLKIPNFEKFRSRLFLVIGGVILLIIALVFAMRVMPKASITLHTDTENLDTNLAFTANPKATEFNQEDAELPAMSKEFRKTDTEKVPASGQKDLGEKASGSVTLKLNNCNADSVTIPAGTTVSTDNLPFVTQGAVTLESIEIGGVCKNADFPNISSESVAVNAANAGDQYNVASGKTFAVSGFSSVSGTNGSAMTGGTSKIVKVIAQQDIDAGKQKIVDRASQEAPEELKKQLQDEGWYPLPDTMSVGSPTIQSSPDVGDEASEVTITSTTSFTMLGVRENDLKTLIEEDAKKRIDSSTQQIRDNGLGNATIKTSEKKPDGSAAMTLQTTVIAGPQLDENAIKQEVAGKKKNETEEIIKKRPGINDVEVSYSPFWVSKTPKNTDKITIIFEDSSNDNNEDNP